MAFLEELKAFEGQVVGPPTLSADEVNQAMIRHWCDAVGDDLPVYTDEEAAKRSVHGGIIAPPTMLQAWTMNGFRPRPAAGAGGNKQAELLDLVAAHGFTSTVATNCEQEYLRELRIGDRVSALHVIDSISDEKHTALGIGHFVTMRIEYRVGDELVGTQRWTILRFKPGTGRGAPAPAPARERPPRPRPSLTRDNGWWFEALREHKLLIQRCTNCQTLRHPPRPMCDRCGSLDWDTIEAAGRGIIFSFVVNHYPQVPAFDYPLPIGLIELAEGTRLVADLVGSEPSDYRIGLPVEVEFVDHDAELTLPAFHLAEGAD